MFLILFIFSFLLWIELYLFWNLRNWDSFSVMQSAIGNFLKYYESHEFRPIFESVDEMLKWAGLYNLTTTNLGLELSDAGMSPLLLQELVTVGTSLSFRWCYIVILIVLFPTHFTFLVVSSEILMILNRTKCTFEIIQISSMHGLELEYKTTMKWSEHKLCYRIDKPSQWMWFFGTSNKRINI